MDLGGLRDSLDSAGSESSALAQASLLRDFKAAALHLTTLYRNSLTCTKDSFREGYQAALNDVLLTLGERRRLTGHAGGSSASKDQGQQQHGRRPLPAGESTVAESAEDQLQWLERYLKGRSEALRLETDAEDDAASVSTPVTAAPKPSALQSTSTPSRPKNARMQSVAAQSQEPSIKTPPHSMRTRMRQADPPSSSQSTPVSHPAPAPSTANHPFTFQAARLPEASPQLGFSRFSQQASTSSPDNSNIPSSPPVAPAEQTAEAQAAEAQLELQRVRPAPPGSGNESRRRAAPVSEQDIIEHLAREAAAAQNNVVEGRMQERKRQKLESDRKGHHAQGKEHHHHGRRRRERDRERERRE